MRWEARDLKYGEIVYDESIWTSKKTLTVNGVQAQPLSKKEFLANGKKVCLNGNVYTGVSLYIDNQAIQLSPKPKWYELILALLPIFFLLTWGNSVFLCAIFPVVGGALGGALGAAGGLTSLYFMKKQASPLTKVLIGVGAFAITVFAGFVLALVMLQLVY